MPIKLQVTHGADADAPNEYVFDEETVMIGRDNANLLTLPDPSRIVSKHHAEIRQMDGGGYELVDLGSKNFTYLNGKRLISGQPSPIQSGDRFKIGEFEIAFELIAAPQSEANRTVFAAEFSNPFDEPAEKLAEVLGSLRRTYAGASAGQRAEALRNALESAMIGGGDEPGTIVARLLSGGEDLGPMGGAPAAPGMPAPPPAAPPAAAPPAVPPAAPPSPPGSDAVDPFAKTSATPFAPFGAPPGLGSPPPAAPPQAFSPQASPPPARPPQMPPAAPPPASPGPSRGAPSPAEDQLVDLLVESIQKLAAIPWRFRHEFIGQTIMQSQESAALFESSPTELRAYLTNPAVDAETLQERRTVLAEAAEAVAVHQLALLDGYKASVQQGAQRLLDTVDPAPIEKEVEASSPMYKVPQLRSPAVIERLKAIHAELSGEDWSIAERRAFRPAFIKAYLARMTRQRF